RRSVGVRLVEVSTAVRVGGMARSAGLPSFPRRRESSVLRSTTLGPRLRGDDESSFARTSRFRKAGSMAMPSVALLSQSVLSGVFIGALYGLLGLGLSLSWGLLRQINLAHFAL